MNGIRDILMCMMKLLNLFKSPFREGTGQPQVPDSKFFCIAPWIQLHAQTHGEVTPCCMSAYKGDSVADLRENSDLAAAWNSPKMKQLRLNMLNGVKSQMCGNCYAHEELGKFSDRMQYNRDYRHYLNRVEEMLPDGTVTELSVPILDIRFSNVCNYKCRICNSSNSSLLYAEDLKLGKISPGKPKIMKAAADDAVFWESYKKLLSGAKRLHFAGGEPSFMDEHYAALEQLIALGNTDVTLSYNTNFSTLTYKKYNLIELWSKFKGVEVWASLDDMGARGDYQRKGQNWAEIERNIKTLQRKCPHALFGIDITVSILNIFSIPKFYQYIVENKLAAPQRVNLYYLNDPEYFNVTNLTPELKEKAKALYADFISGYLETFAGTEKMKEHALALMNYMMSKQLQKQQEFIRRITETDKLREENFADLFPELAEMRLPETKS